MVIIHLPIQYNPSLIYPIYADYFPRHKHFLNACLDGFAVQPFSFCLDSFFAMEEKHARIQGNTGWIIDIYK